jgi:hypothetical protein
MTVQQLFERIESPTFSYRVTVESSLRRALLNIADQPDCQSLINLIKTEGKSEPVLSRLIVLTRQSVDPRYQNPHDVAMATYLFTLQQTNAQVARIGAEATIAVAGTWWASKIAQLILDRAWITNVSSGVMTHGPSGPISSSQNARDDFLVSSLAMSALRKQEAFPVVPATSRTADSRNVEFNAPVGHATTAKVSHSDSGQQVEKDQVAIKTPLP